MVYRRLLSVFYQQSRQFSAQQAAVALRPFYFAVHPDRFGSDDPEVRSGNEKALQIFNGYLSGLFPSPIATMPPPPVKVNFRIRRGGSQELEEITMELTGGDPAKIVRLALESCHLNTSHLPIANRAAASPFISPPTSPFGPRSDMSSELRKGTNQGYYSSFSAREHRVKNKPARASTTNDLLSGIQRLKNVVVQKEETHKQNAESLAADMDSLVRKTGVKKIIWTIDWDESYMRRCLANVENMFLQADTSARNSMIHALYGHNLILGRGSHICCDGSLQFGADDAVGAWAKVCMESMVHRFDLANLERLTDRVRLLLGGDLLINPMASLSATINQLKTMITRISSSPKADMGQLAIAGRGALFEIGNAYNEPVVLRDGTIHIPCNIPFPLLLKFVSENATTSRQIGKRAQQLKVELSSLSDTCRLSIGLKRLTWDSTIAHSELVESLGRLYNAGAKLRDELAGLSIHLSTNLDIRVLPDGRISIPLNWI